MDAGLKATHDLLLAIKPEGAVHDAETCAICTPDHPEGGSVPETYTEEQLANAITKAVAEATAPLQAKVTELENSQQKSEMDAAVESAKAEAQAAIDDLQTKLDAAVIDATAAKEAKEQIEQFWANAVAEAEEATVREARREERLAKLKDEAHFPEEFLKENEERFVAMSDEEFAARLEEYKTQYAALAGSGGNYIPETTALHASRTTTTTKPGSALREVLDLRRAGIDPRAVRS